MKKRTKKLFKALRGGRVPVVGATAPAPQAVKLGANYLRHASRSAVKSFLVLFFKKEHPSLPLPFFSNTPEQNKTLLFRKKAAKNF